MSKLETSIYIVGTSRTWQFRARSLQLLIGSVIFLLLGLTGALLYQSIYHLQVVGELQEKYQNETHRTEKMRTVIEDLRQRVVDRSTIAMQEAMYAGPSVEELLRKNQRQQETLEDQQQKLTQLQTDNRAKQEELLQLQYQQNNAEKRIESLAESHHRLEVQRAELQLALEAKEERLAALQTELTQLQAQQAEAAAVLAVAKPSSAATPAPQPELPPQPFPVDVEALQLVPRGNGLEVRFKLRNQSESRQRGHLGVYLLSANEASKEMPYQERATETYSIRNFKNVSERLPEWSPNGVVRVVAWDQDKQPVMDRTFSLASVN
jgi:DNA repair exonuclease SbcCD ATPase subunit